MENPTIKKESETTLNLSVTPSKPATASPPSAIVFQKYDDTKRKRLILSVEGLHSCGKTNFALTAPGPVAIHDLDTGLEGVAEKFVGKKEIFSFSYIIPQSIALPGTPMGSVLAEEAKKVWETFVLQYRESLKKARTVVVDTGSELWELARLARLGKLAQVLPHNYAAINAEFRELLRLAYKHDCNLILLHKLKREYINEKFTGNYERAGFNDIDFVAQVTLRATKDPKGEGLNKFNLKISKCRQNPLLEETVLTGEECNFAKVAAMVTNSSEEEWM